MDSVHHSLRKEISGYERLLAKYQRTSDLKMEIVTRQILAKLYARAILTGE